MLYRDRLKSFAFFVTVFIGVMKTGSTQSSDISSPPYVNLNPQSSITSVQRQLKRMAVRTCGSNNILLLSSWLQKIPPINIHCIWTECMGEGCVDVSTVRCWIWQFKPEEVGGSKYVWHSKVGEAIDCNRTEIKNLLKAGRSILKLEEIMWNSDYAQLLIKVKGTFIFCFT